MANKTWTEKDKQMDYYNENAEDFIKRTFNADMTGLYDRFLKYVPKGGRILDMGCGSSRDSKWFLEQGFDIYAHDKSQKMVEHGRQFLGNRIQLSSFEDFDPVIFGRELTFDGYWANASLLHVPEEELIHIIEKYMKWLKPGGCFYMSFKQDKENHTEGIRHFTNMNLEKVYGLLGECRGLKVLEVIESGDVRQEKKNESWINVFGLRISD